jgi:hypothetical protein
MGGRYRPERPAHGEGSSIPVTGVAPTDNCCEPVGVPSYWRVRAMRLEFGPSRSLHDLCRALGDALASTRLIASRVAVLPTVDGYVLQADCEAGDEESEVLEVLARLLDDAAP